MKKFSFFLISFMLLLHSCKVQNTTSDKRHRNYVSKIEGKEININDSISSNKDLDEFIAPYAEHIEEEMSATLAYAPKSLSKTDSKYNTAIGNMEADAVLEMLQPLFVARMQDSIDGVLLNYGGIRSTINQGNITTKTGYNLMPFENEAVVVKLSAEAMQELFNYLAEHQAAHPLSGMQLILNPDGSINKANIQNKNLENGKFYYIATNDYLKNGGDHMDFFAKNDTVITMNYKLRNLFIDYFKKKDTIAPVRDERFIKLKE